MTRDELSSFRREMVELRKQLILSELRDSLRLRAAMPSQNGEDVLLYNFFDRKRQGFFVEIGAYDGIAFSNTYFFEALGWSGLLIEPVPDRYQSCLEQRPHSRVLNAAVGSVQKTVDHFSAVEGSNGVGTLSFLRAGPEHLERIRREGGIIQNIEVPVYSLNDILTDHQGEIEFVSVDVEGSEIDVLEGFDLERFQPMVLVIEANSNGARSDVTEYLAGHGYSERYCCEHNVFYTRSQDRRAFRW